MPGLSVAAIIDLLATRIPFDRAAAWDVSGLHLGDARAEVRRLGVCHEIDPEVVRTLEHDPVDLLVTYHPLVFRPTNRFVAGATPVGRAHRLVRMGVSVVVAHTAFDMASGGTADALAETLGLEEIAPFGPSEGVDKMKIVTFAPADAVDGLVDAMSSAGAGAIGNYRACHFRIDGIGGFHAGPGADPFVGARGSNHEPEARIEMIAPATIGDRVVAALVGAHPYEEPAFDVYPVRGNEGFIGRVGRREGPLDDLVSLVVDRMGPTGLRVSGPGSTPIRRVAVVPGSGSSFVAAAAAEGCDVLVTGDVGHHVVIEARDRGVAIIDPGHASTERPGMRALVAMIEELVAGSIEVVDLTGLDPTPWR